MILFTSRAERAVCSLRQSMGRRGSGLRIAITGGSPCGGYAYFVGFEDEPTKDDLRFPLEDFVVYVDPVSYRELKGAKVDFVDSAQGSGFVVTPCGEQRAQPRCCCSGSATSKEEGEKRAGDGRCPARNAKRE